MKPFILAMILMAAGSAHAQDGLCADLRGHYADCEISAAAPQKIEFDLDQAIVGGDMVYTAKFKYQNEDQTTSFVTDGNQHPLVITGTTARDTGFIYQATCDLTQLSGLVWNQKLSDSAQEKMAISKGADGSLSIQDQTVLFGRVVRSQTFTCQRAK